MIDTLGELADFIRVGLGGAEPGGSAPPPHVDPGPAGGNVPPADEVRPPGPRARTLLEALFGTRYPKRHFAPAMVRDELAQEHVPFAGLVGPASAPAGPFAGLSVLWFPTPAAGSLVALMVGPLGLGPDKAILTRPAHRRRLADLERQLVRRGVEAWAKPHSAAFDMPVPPAIRPAFGPVFETCESRLYCLAQVPREDARRPLARSVVAAFFDLFAFERGWAIKRQPFEDSTPGLDILQTDVMTPVGWW